MDWWGTVYIRYTLELPHKCVKGFVTFFSFSLLKGVENTILMLSRKSNFYEICAKLFSWRPILAECWRSIHSNNIEEITGATTDDNISIQTIICTESASHLLLKGQSNEIFDLQFFRHSNLPGPLNKGLTYFRFHWIIRILVWKNWLPPVSFVEWFW